MNLKKLLFLALTLTFLGCSDQYKDLPILKTSDHIEVNHTDPSMPTRQIELGIKAIIKTQNTTQKLKSLMVEASAPEKGKGPVIDFTHDTSGHPITRRVEFKIIAAFGSEYPTQIQTFPVIMRGNTVDLNINLKVNVPNDITETQLTRTDGEATHIWISGLITGVDKENPGDQSAYITGVDGSHPHSLDFSLPTTLYKVKAGKKVEVPMPLLF